MRLLASVLVWLALATAAMAQTGFGQIPAFSVLGNATGSPIEPVATTNPSILGLTIIPPNGTTIGLNILETSGAVSVAGVVSNYMFGGNPSFAYNQIFANDQLTVTGSGIFYTGGTAIGLLTGGANSQGTKVALAVQLVKQVASSPSPIRDHIALQSSAVCQASEGGTGTGAGTAKGTCFGAGITANLTTDPTHGTSATNYFSVSGAEVDVGIAASNSAYARLGWSVVGNGAVAAAGTYDVAYEISATGTDPGFKMGLMFSSLHGGQPISTGGTLIGTDAVAVAATGLTGINFSNYTSSNMTTFLRGPGGAFSVAGAGPVTVNVGPVNSIGFNLISTASHGSGFAIYDTTTGGYQVSWTGGALALSSLNSSGAFVALQAFLTTAGAWNWAAYTTAGVLVNDASGNITSRVGVSQTCTVNTASALTLIFTGGVLTGGTCNI